MKTETFKRKHKAMGMRFYGWCKAEGKPFTMRSYATYVVYMMKENHAGRMLHVLPYADMARAIAELAPVVARRGNKVLKRVTQKRVPHKPGPKKLIEPKKVLVGVSLAGKIPPRGH